MINKDKKNFSESITDPYSSSNIQAIGLNTDKITAQGFVWVEGWWVCDKEMVYLWWGLKLKSEQEMSVAVVSVVESLSCPETIKSCLIHELD